MLPMAASVVRHRCCVDAWSAIALRAFRESGFVEATSGAKTCGVNKELHKCVASHLIGRLAARMLWSAAADQLILGRATISTGLDGPLQLNRIRGRWRRTSHRRNRANRPTDRRARRLEAIPALH